MDFSGFSYFFPEFFRLFRCGLGAVLWILVISATFSLVFSGFWARFGSCFSDFSGFSYFFGDFSGCFAVFGELFCGFQQFQLLFSRIFPAFGMDWGAVLEVLWITATQSIPKAGKQALDTRNSTYKIPFLNLKSFM